MQKAIEIALSVGAVLLYLFLRLQDELNIISEESEFILSLAIGLVGIAVLIID